MFDGCSDGAGPAKDSLEATRAAIRFTPPANADIDVHRFEALAQSAEPDDLAAASELYRGEFLEGLDINSEPFAEWLTIERSRLASIACDTLRRLALLRSQAGDAASAIAAAQRLLSLDPLREDGHRILMELYAAEGRRSDALRQFASCREIMRRELGVEPDRETLALVDRIKTRMVAAPSTSAPAEEPGPVQPTIAGAPTVRPEHALSEPAGAEIAGDDTRHVALPGNRRPCSGSLGAVDTASCRDNGCCGAGWAPSRERSVSPFFGDCGPGTRIIGY